MLAAAGLPWQIGSCWCEKSACAAEVVNRSTGKIRLVTLSLDHGRDLAEPRSMLRALASYGLAKLLGGGLFLAIVIYLLFSVFGR